MHYNVFSLPVSEPLRAVRRDFERRMNVNTADTSGLTISETEASVSVSLDLPGVSEEAVEVTVHDGVLTISGDRPVVLPEDARVLFSSQPSGDFRRTLRLDDSIDPTTVEAVIENGVLTINMSRRPEMQPQRINVRNAGSPK